MPGAADPAVVAGDQPGDRALDLAARGGPADGRQASTSHPGDRPNEQAPDTRPIVLGGARALDRATKRLAAGLRQSLPGGSLSLWGEVRELRSLRLAAFAV